MVDNGMSISIQRNYDHFGKRRHPQAVNNYFFKQQWIADDNSIAFYIERELRELNRIFWHPSVTVIEMLLLRAHERITDVLIAKIVTKVRDDCKVWKKM